MYSTLSHNTIQYNTLAPPPLILLVNWREADETQEKYTSRWVHPLGAVEVLEPDYESSSGAPGKTPQSFSDYTHNSYVFFTVRYSSAEFAEYEMICKALRTEHQELQEDMISLKHVVHRLKGLRKEYHVRVCVRG